MKNKTKESNFRTIALAWWNSLPQNIQLKLHNKSWTPTGREIEEIWRKEVGDLKLHKGEIVDESYPEAFQKTHLKPNQKQFKQFDESLFEAYINKFSDEDKLKGLICILNELSEEVQFNAFLATLRKMKLDSQTESNIMTLVALKDI